MLGLPVTSQTGCPSVCPASTTCTDEWAVLSSGFPGDVVGDSKACREYHLAAAEAGSPEVHCAHANGETECTAANAVAAGFTGPGGEPNIAGFCTAHAATCASVADAGPWPSCANDSAAMSPGPAQTAAGHHNTNNFGCHAYHLAVAQTNAASAAVHCKHASKDGSGGICTNPPTTTTATTTTMTTKTTTKTTTITSTTSITTTVASTILMTTTLASTTVAIPAVRSVYSSMTLRQRNAQTLIISKLQK